MSADDVPDLRPVRDGASNRCPLVKDGSVGVASSGAASSWTPLELARRYLHQRGLRRDVFGVDVFREPAWDIILDLYCARLSNKEVSIMDASIAAGVPSTTGFRYVRRLLASKLVTRRRDIKDRRRSWLRLSDEAATQIEAWLMATWPEHSKSLANDPESRAWLAPDLIEAMPPAE